MTESQKYCTSFIKEQHKKKELLSVFDFNGLMEASCYKHHEKYDNSTLIINKGRVTSEES